MRLQPPLPLWLQYIERCVGFVLPNTQHRWLVNAIIMVADRESISTQALYDNLESSDRLRQRLIDEVLIAESRFFRDASAITFIAQQYQAVVDKSGRSSFVVTSIGCSTGQEVWSIAMALSDVHHASDTVKPASYKVVGVDASIKSLEVAVAAVYPLKSQSEIPVNYQKYINDDGRYWQPTQTIKECVWFDVCNVFDERDFDVFLQKQQTLSSVVICQNMLIYFRKFDQRDILARFERLLAPNGYLVLGAGEGLFWQPATLQKITHPLINLWQKQAEF